jgi:hypothetical protein
MAHAATKERSGGSGHCSAPHLRLRRDERVSPYRRPGRRSRDVYRRTWYASFTKNPSFCRDRRDQLNSSSVSSELP